MSRKLISGLFVLGLACHSQALEPAAERLAGRYEKILAANPRQETALDRLWQIYSTANEPEALLARYAELSKSDAGASVIHAELLARAGRTGEAEQAYRQAAKLLPDEPLAAESLANFLLKNGKPAEAAVVLGEAARKFPDRPQLLLLTGEAFVAAGKKDEATAIWEKALEASPNDGALRKKVVAACVDAGDYAGAIRHLEAGIDTAPAAEKLDRLDQVASLAAESGDAGKEFRARQSALDLLGPGHWRVEAATRELAEAAQRSGKFAELEKQWTAEAEKAPSAANIRRLVVLHAVSGDSGSQRLWLNKAVALNAGDAQSLTELAALEMAHGDVEKALSLRKTVAGLRPDDADAAFALAATEAAGGRVSEAEKTIEAFLASHPEEPHLAERAMDFYAEYHLNEPLEKRLRAADLTNIDAAEALATFLVGAKRYPEAAEVIRNFGGLNLSPSDAAAAKLRLGGILANAGMSAEAGEIYAQAFGKDPKNTEAALALAANLDSQGKRKEAIAILEKSAALQPLPPEQIDRRLYSLIVRPSEGPVPGGSPELRSMTQALTMKAWSDPSAENVLRASRWSRWTGDFPGAIRILNAGIGANPKSRQLRQTLADVFVENQDPGSAVTVLTELQQLEPARANEIGERIGNVLLDSGDSTQALAVFSEIAERNPADWKALANLANAQQRAGNWTISLELWKRIFAMAPDPAKPGIRAPLLAAMARLGLHDEAFEFLAGETARAGSLAKRREILQSGLAYANENRKLDEWRAVIASRAAQPGDKEAWRLALADMSRDEASRETDSASAEVLAERLKTAAAAGDWEGAAAIAARLATPDGDFQPAAQLALALELSGRAQEAATAWEAISRRFSRQPEAQLAAAEFFRRTGNAAAEAARLRAASELSGAAPTNLLRLAGLSRNATDLAKVLSTSLPQLSGWQTNLPLPGRIADDHKAFSYAIQNASARNLDTISDFKMITVPTPDTAEGCRLIALRELARQGAERPESLAPVETLWFDFHSGKIDEALPEAARLIEGTDSPIPKACLAAMALDGGRPDFIRSWAGGDSPRWAMVLAAFEFLLAEEWEPPKDVATLFDPAPAHIAWRAAQSLAVNRHVKAAVTLGVPLISKMAAAQRSAAWLEIGNWQAAARDIEGAKASFDQAIATSLPSVCYAQPVFAAIRQRYLLTQPEERAQVAETILSTVSKLAPPAYAEAAAALIEALTGNLDAAKIHLPPLIARIGTSEDEDWSSIIEQGGRQLEDWKLGRFARDLYRAYLFSSIRETANRRNTEALIVASKLAGANPAEADFLIREWLARRPSENDVFTVVSRTAAPVVFDLAFETWKKQPENTRLLNLAASSASCREERFALWTEVEKKNRDALSGQYGSEYSTWLAEARGPGAVLDVLKTVTARNSPAFRARIDLLRKAGKGREALELLAAMPDRAPDLETAYAELLAQAGREKEAAALLERQSRGSTAQAVRAGCVLAEIQAGMGDEAGLLRTTKRLATFTNGARAAAIRSAAGLGLGSPAPAAVSAAPVPQGKEEFDTGATLLRDWQGMPDDLRAIEFSHLEALAAGNPDLARPLGQLRREMLKKFPEVTRASLEQAWKNGDENAGAMLAAEALKKGDAAPAEKILGEPGLSALAFARDCLTAGKPELALRALERLGAPDELRHEETALHAEALWKSGRTSEAEAAVQPLLVLAPVYPGIRAALAEYFLETGRAPEAFVHLSALPTSGNRPNTDYARVANLLASRAIEAGDAALIQSLLASPWAAAISPANWAEILLSTDGPSAPLEKVPSDSYDATAIEIAARLIEDKKYDAAWKRLEDSPTLLALPEAGVIMDKLAATDPDRACKLWARLAEESPLDSVRKSAAAFLLAQAGPGIPEEKRTGRLMLAHKLDPGSFAIAKALSDTYARAGKTAEARRVLEDVVSAMTSPADRNSARKSLDSLALSPTLPQEL